MVAPVVHRFAATTSFDGARANFVLLQEVSPELWTRDLVELAERAIEDNGQLAGANLVTPVPKPIPEATRELLRPIRERLSMDVQVETSVSDDDIPF
jgi:hypothetical protein